MSFAALRYQSARVDTVSPVSVVVSLYEGAMRFLREAIVHDRAHHLGRRGVALSRAHAIVTELRVTLDHDRAPEISAQLEGLYDFVLGRISEATQKGDATLVEPALTVLASLHTAWLEIAKKAP